MGCQQHHKIKPISINVNSENSKPSPPIPTSACSICGLYASNISQSVLLEDTNSIRRKIFTFNCPCGNAWKKVKEHGFIYCEYLGKIKNSI